MANLQHLRPQLGPARSPKAFHARLLFPRPQAADGAVLIPQPQYERSSFFAAGEGSAEESRARKTYPPRCPKRNCSRATHARSEFSCLLPASSIFAKAGERTSRPIHSWPTRKFSRSRPNLQGDPDAHGLSAPRLFSGSRATTDTVKRLFPWVYPALLCPANPPKRSRRRRSAKSCPVERRRKENLPAPRPGRLLPAFRQTMPEKTETVQ